MAESVDLVIQHESEGTIKWEQWWVAKHGYERRDLPTYEDYLSFIDVDLAHNGLPRLTRRGDQIVIPRVPVDRVSIATQVVEYHGFRVLPPE